MNPIIVQKVTALQAQIEEEKHPRIQRDTYIPKKFHVEQHQESPNVVEISRGK